MTLVRRTDVAYGMRDSWCDIRDFNGFDPSGNNVQDSLVLQWLTQGSVAGVICIGPAKATVAMDAGILLLLSAHLMVDLSANFVLKSTPNLAKPIVDIRDNTIDRHIFRMSWRGGRLDNRLGHFSPSAQSNTCMNLSRLVNSEIVGTEFSGADDYFTARTTTDTGVTAGDCLGLHVLGCYIHGQGDIGLYLGGSDHQEAAEQGRDYLIAGNTFADCQVATSFKRQQSGMLISGNTVRACSAAFTAFPATSGTVTFQAGRQILVTGNTAKKIGGAFFAAYGGDNYAVLGNVIEDFGYDPTDATFSAFTAAQFPYAIFNRGATNMRADHNNISLKDWATLSGGTNGSSGHAAIAVGNYDLVQPDNVTTARFTSDFFRYTENQIYNVKNAVVEESTFGAPGPTFGFQNSYVNCDNKLIPLNSSSNFEYFDLSIFATRKFQSGGATLSEVARDSSTQSTAVSFATFLDATAVKRIAKTTASFAGLSVAANSSASFTVALTGAVAGTDQVEIFPSAASAEPDGLLVRAFISAADTITVRFRNLTGSTITPVTNAYVLTLLRIS